MARRESPENTAGRRQQMLTAAAALIAAQGYGETRIADVARRANVSPGLVVYYFGSKDRLLVEALRYSDVTTSTAVTRPWDDGVDRYEGVLGYRLTVNVRAKLAFQRTLRYPFAADRVQDDLVAGSLSIRF